MKDQIQNKQKMFRTLFFGGILPVIAFTVIEEKFGTAAGILAGMIFGGGEILWEWRHLGKIEPITIGGNALILILGGIALIAKEGIWFKLQPAIMELVMAVVLFAGLFTKKSLFVALAEKQGQVIPPQMHAPMKAMSARLALFFLAHAILATWAALQWSTSAWALLKGVGFTASMVLYMFVEGWWMRKNIRKNLEASAPIGPTKRS